MDRYELTSLDTARDLLRNDRPVAATGDALVIADPDFDLEISAVPAAERSRPFARLTGTREEGEAIAEILHVPPLLGPDALESVLYSARSPRILHIATHGFFLADDRPPPWSNVADTVVTLTIPGYGTHLVKALDKPRPINDGPMVDRLTRIGRLPDPMLRSGVALAGSNTWVS
ncbi:MAG TPA: CHAT domain-containing protein, partial [Acidobacteriaceae bacterium]